jgi:hypothetical protein
MLAILTVCLVGMINLVYGQTNDLLNDTNLLSNGYNMSGQTNINYTDILNNHMVGPDDPEISCTGVSFGGESSTSCRLINYTKYTLDSEKLRKEIDKNREDYLKNLTEK